MFYPLTTQKIPNCMTSFWHASCMTSPKSHRTPLIDTLHQKSVVYMKQIFSATLRQMHISRAEITSSLSAYFVKRSYLAYSKAMLGQCPPNCGSRPQVGSSKTFLGSPYAHGFLSPLVSVYTTN